MTPGSDPMGAFARLVPSFSVTNTCSPSRTRQSMTTGHAPSMQYFSSSILPIVLTFSAPLASSSTWWRK